MAARTNCDPDRICIFRDILDVRWGLVLGFIKLETDMGKVVKFWDGASLDLRCDTTFEYAV